VIVEIEKDAIYYTPAERHGDILQTEGCGCCSERLLKGKDDEQIKIELKENITKVKEVCEFMGWDFEKFMEESK